MKPFFSQLEIITRLESESSRWIGTPFFPFARICGAGVDCVNLAAEILKACGHAVSYEMPRYAMDGGKHQTESQLGEYLESREDFIRVENSESQPGDVLCFIGMFRARVPHHCGLMLSRNQIIHALPGRKVSFATLSDKTFSRSLAAVYRPVIV